jgi:dolichol-phosphate mannosyltransferase
MGSDLDIVIPVYNEGRNILPTVDALAKHLAEPFRVMICYDRDDDDTLVALNDYQKPNCEIRFVKNRGEGAIGAVLTGFADSTAGVVLMIPADDDYNAPRLNEMIRQMREGNDIVAPSRFMRGGCMVGCPWLKATLVRLAAATLYYVAGMPTHDPTNGFRFFSRRVLDRIPIESTVGFAYSLELLVKCHRLGWKIAEVPAEWYERKAGTSRFKVIKWVPQYLRWFWYGFATTFLLRRASSVKLKPEPSPTVMANAR